MVAVCDVLAPPDGHVPLILRSTLGADYKVYHFDRGLLGLLLIEKFAYMEYDLADEVVALARSPIIWGSRNLENGDYNRAPGEINSE